MCLGIPGQIVDLAEVAQHKATVDIDGVRREVNVGLVVGEDGGIDIGDWVLVHVGFAMTKIDEEEADRTMSFLKELGSVYDDEIDQFKETTPL